ncbi:cytochrome P450 4C1 [Nasonia vitripennis]|uniref:Cytochrome P450 n=1 Tax=Nasonia vitripennis TaxID=7425 RepID=A0A7M7G2W9_NASVI|nr:cytochrome P450 4C1 [Nasonia vitripennis]
MIFYLSSLLLVLCIFHIITRYNRRGRLLSKIPGPTAYPIVGNLLMFNMSSMHDFWQLGRLTMKKYYPITRFWGLHSALISVGHPEDLEILLSSQKVIEKGYVYWYLQPWLRTGLLTSTDDKWRQRRKILTPAFHFSILQKYFDITSEQGERFIEDLKAEGDETIKSLMPLCSNYTLNIICESILGVVLNKMNDQEVKKYKQAILDVGSVVLYRTVRPFIANWMLPFVWKIGHMQRNALKILHDFTDKVLKERRKYHESTGYRYLNDEYTGEVKYDLGIGRKRRLAMLDLLLAAEKNGLIQEDGIKEEVDTFTFEGHDTSSMAMTFTLMLLAENKEAQDLARVEVIRVLDKSGGKIGVTEIQELHYLERCLKESFRLYPPVATLMRYVSEELELKNATVPADSHVMIHFWDTHRDVNFWPEPDKFDPDRFLPENAKNRHPYAYVPFSAGPRNCIGQKFAIMELKSLIARILYDFYLEPVDRTTDMRLIADIILRPLDPVHLKFIKINKC